MRDTDAEVFKGAMYCCLCGLCERVSCPQGLAPRQLIRLFKGKLSEAGIRPEKLEAVPVRERKYRRVDEERLKVRLGLAKYDLEAPMEEAADE
jgi:Na+-translocating ferredoxin:NAD+ oxidoreductase RnfC subunit